MALSRKHYNDLAELVREVQTHYDGSISAHDLRRELRSFSARHGQNFDGYKFDAACEVER